jgi:DMSO/TMAO reductase YedYZ molybdopterin-dependent catalytic subunit
MMKNVFALSILVSSFIFCSSPSTKNPMVGEPDNQEEIVEEITSKFPDFITKNQDYYVTRIGSVPEINPDTYSLSVTGISNTTLTFSLDDLKSLPMVEFPLTVECIGNSAPGVLLSTAYWKGINIYDFLTGLGMSDLVGGVKYKSADGYFASHTLNQIKDNNVIGALFMNGESIPALHGFPIRIVNPGYYGVKQPAWVTSIEIIPIEEISSKSNDYWALRYWDVSPRMAADCKIFFPPNNRTIQIGDTLAFGGAAYGGTRISVVEISMDTGQNWQETEIIKSIDADNVWVYWYKELIFADSGNYTILVRATDFFGNVQQQHDSNHLDGNSEMPRVRVTVEDR